MIKIIQRLLTALLLAVATGFSATTINFNTLPDRSWVRVDVTLGHVYGMSEVDWSYDAFHKKFVRIGGCTGGYTNEVYAYYFNGNGQFVSEQVLAPGTGGGSNRPGLGCSRGICYDSKRHLIWSYGGLGSPPDGVAMSGQNWALMGLDLSDNSWRMAPGSDAVQLKQACQLEYDPDHDAILLFGNDMGAWGNCWLYEFSTGKWRKIGNLWHPDGVDGNPAYKRPTYDPVNHVFVVLMGKAGDPQTWVFNPATMTDWDKRRPSSSPPFRNWYGMAYDQVSRKVLLHGGAPSGDWQGVNDTWSYNAATNVWTRELDLGASRLPVTGNPNSVVSWQGRVPALDYDAEHNAVMLMCTAENSVWVYRHGGGAGTALSNTPAAPAGRGLSVWPNPFSHSTRISLVSPAGSPASLEILSADGRLVEKLGFGAVSGGLGVDWNAAGRAPGIYFARVKTGGEAVTRPLHLVNP